MADFGLSRVLESDATHVSTFTYGTHVSDLLSVSVGAANCGLDCSLLRRSLTLTYATGTAAYMAPELLQRGKMTRAADVYSFAMIMVELYTCKRLFEGLAQQQVPLHAGPAKSMSLAHFFASCLWSTSAVRCVG